MMTRLAFVAAALAVSACSPEIPSENPPDEAASVLLTVPGLAPYIGVWEGADGQLRQVLEIADGGVAVDACMLALDEERQWRTVSHGRYVAEGNEIRGSFTGDGMGFESLSVVGYPVGGDGGVDWVNTAVTSEGEMTTYETWAAPGGGVFTYVIERGEGVDRELWFAGQWRFRGYMEVRCG